MLGKRLLLVGVLMAGWASTGCRSWCEHHVCPPAQPACYAPAACAPAPCCTPCVPAPAAYAPAPAYNNPGACCAPAAR
jgi:hypothetical protein